MSRILNALLNRYEKAIVLIDDKGAAHGAPDNPIIDSDFKTAIARGLDPNRTALRKFGRNSDVGATLEDVWGFGGLYTYLTAAEIPNVVSSSANDAAAGTGVRTVRVYGLDANWNEQQEDVTLNGITPVALLNSYIRISRIQSLTAGATGVNEGNIDVTNAAGTVVLARAEIEHGQTEMLLWSVPAGKTFYMTKYSMVTAQAKDVEVHIYTRTFGGAWRVLDVALMRDTSKVDTFEFPLPFPAKSDIAIRAHAAAGAAVVSGRFEGWVE